MAVSKLSALEVNASTAENLLATFKIKLEKLESLVG